MMIAAGNALLAVTLTVPSLLAGVGLAGAGIGLSSVASTAVGTDLPEPLQGAATGALNTAAQLGTALGTAALLTLTTITARAAIPIHGSRLGWLVAALIAAVGAAATTRSARTHGSARLRPGPNPALRGGGGVGGPK
jgi:MFS family permease